MKFFHSNAIQIFRQNSSDDENLLEMLNILVYQNRYGDADHSGAQSLLRLLSPSWWRFIAVGSESFKASSEQFSSNKSIKSIKIVSLRLLVKLKCGSILITPDLVL